VTTIVCVGGGIVGVFAALRSRQHHPNARIILVEQDDAIGGLLRSDPHEDGLNYDRGTHILSETGVGEIDALLFADLPEDEWCAFGGARRDLCGLLQDREVHEASPFLTAAEVPAAYASTPNPSRAGYHATLWDYLVDHHGADVANAVFRQPIRNLYRRELEELAPFAARQLPLSRIVRDDMATWLARLSETGYRNWIACPDQRELPAIYASPLRALYPRQMGIGQLFAVLGRKLEAAGVEIRLATSLVGLARAPTGRIAAADMQHRDGTQEHIPGPLFVIWAATPLPLPRLLGAAAPKAKPVPAWTPVILDFRAELARPLDCYYYIDYGTGDGFRLTNYAAFCAQAASLSSSPFTYEIWWRGGQPDLESLSAFAADRLERLGLSRPGTALTHARLRRTQHGVLLPTSENMAAFEALTSGLKAAAPENFMNIGLLSQPNLFFTGDMLKNAEQCLREAA
jgi:hypothetical protein